MTDGDDENGDDGTPETAPEADGGAGAPDDGDGATGDPETADDPDAAAPDADSDGESAEGEAGDPSEEVSDDSEEESADGEEVSGGSEEGSAENEEEDGDDSDEESEELAPQLGVEELDERLDETEEALGAAETEADLDDVAGDLDALAETLDAAELPEPDEEDEQSPGERLEARLEGLRDDLETQRGPYAEDVTADLADAQSVLTETRWTERGADGVVEAVAAFLTAAGEALDAGFERDGDDPEALADALQAASEAVEGADLHPDDDADTIAALVEAVEGLSADLEAAEEWDDLVTHEQLQAQGFYDVLGHYKDFPVEWAALKEHEQQGNAEMIMLALEELGSEFMERHCLEALQRLGPPEAFEEMHGRAEKRDRPAIRILGKIGDDRAVGTLLEYVDEDSDPQLQKVTFKALGEIGSREATQALANKLVMDDDNVRPYAARALGMIGDPRAIDPLAEALESDDSDNVRAAAAWALRQIGTERALEAAAAYADDRTYIVQAEAEAAADALESVPAGA